MDMEDEYRDLLDQLRQYGVPDQWGEPSGDELARMRECLDCSIRDAADDKLLVLAELAGLGVIVIGLILFLAF